MRILFVKRSQSYPRSSGHDVHAYHMMRGLVECGASVSLLTEVAVEPRAIEGLSLDWVGTYGDLPEVSRVVSMTGLRERFRRYWGVEPAHVQAIASLAESHRYDAIVVAIAGGLALFGGAKNAARIWYVADDQMLHSWSLLDWKNPATWKRMREGCLHGLYERVYRRDVDRVWLVSKRDAWFSRFVMGAAAADVIPNGVDSAYFAPRAIDKLSQSCVFWGRLDFAPNLDAIRWFGKHVWMKLRDTHPQSIWSVYGFAAGAEVKALQAEYGFRLTCDLPDLRDEVSRHQVVVLPFVSGAGVKNKLLEAAALGMPILASGMATNGLEGDSIPVRLATTPHAWRTQLSALWSDSERCAELGEQTRAWVVEHHAWLKSARLALRGIEETLAGRTRGR
ncbi:MAG: glycosyltransferase [Pirellula sp.]